MEPIKFSFPVKHWGTTLIVSPILLGIYDAVVDTRFVFDDLEVYTMIVSMSAVLSLPALGVYILLYSFLHNAGISSRSMRIILLVTASLMVLIAFWLIGGNLAGEMSGAYCLGVLITSFFFQPRVKDQKVGESGKG